MSKSFVVLDSYREAAKADSAIWNYKGLAIHAVPAIHEHVAKIVKQSLPEGSSVLDLAAGSGAMCLRLRDLGMQPTGTDLVTENFRLHSEVDFFTANLNEDLPPELLGRFDCVVATELIEHLENPRHLVRQCHSMLRPGGLLIVSTPNVENSISMAQFIRTGDFRWFAPEQYHRDGHITPILLSVLRHALKETGFSDIRIDSIAPFEFRGLEWWRMRLLAWLLRAVAGRKLLECQFLVACAIRPQPGAPN